jgi:hypothetical protein
MTASLPDTPYLVTRPYTPQEARDYCARLAKSHYENFLVASLFVPRALKQHFYNVYAYCRISDDLGDESGGPENALPLVGGGARRLLRGQPAPSGIRRAGGDERPVLHPKAALRGPPHGLPTGSGEDALPDLRRGAGLL